MRRLIKWFGDNVDDVTEIAGTALVIGSIALIVLFFVGCGVIATIKIWALIW